MNDVFIRLEQETAKTVHKADELVRVINVNGVSVRQLAKEIGIPVKVLIADLKTLHD